jgi:hypothetical protein
MVGHLEGYRPLENLDMNARIIFKWILNGFGCVDRIDLAQDRENWRAVMNTVMNIWVL